MDAKLRNRQRNGDEARLQSSQKGRDISEPLRGQYRSPITDLAATSQLLGNDERSLIHLRPCQALGETGGVDLIVNEGVGRGIRLPAGSLLQQTGRDDWVTAIALPSCRVLLLLTGVSHVGVGCINAQWAY